MGWYGKKFRNSKEAFSWAKRSKTQTKIIGLRNKKTKKHSGWLVYRHNWKSK